MKTLFIISSHVTGAWLSEITHPYWHLAQRGVDVDFASPAGGKISWSPYSDPYFAQSMESDDIVSKGFLSDSALVHKLATTLTLADIDLAEYDAVHVAGGQGATFDLFPNPALAKVLEHFWAHDKVVGALCHGAIALANNPERVLGRHVTGFTLEADKELEYQFGPGFILPNYPQTSLEDAGAVYSRVASYAPYVVVDGKLVTGENQQSATEYAIALFRAMTGKSAVTVIAPAAKPPLKALFVITSHDTGAWLSEITHPYWHLTERGVLVDFASPAGGKVTWSLYSDPYFAQSMEKEDIVSKGFLADPALAARLEQTLRLRDVDLAPYDVVHLAGGQGTTFDFYPNKDIARTLEHFWLNDKLIGAICHGAIGLANNRDRVRGRRVTGFTLAGDKGLQEMFGSGFVLPHYPQTALEEAGALYSSDGPYTPHVVVDGRLVTGTNQQSASEYAIALFHALSRKTPVSRYWRAPAAASIFSRLLRRLKYFGAVALSA